MCPRRLRTRFHSLPTLSWRRFSLAGTWLMGSVSQALALSASLPSFRSRSRGSSTACFTGQAQKAPPSTLCFSRGSCQAQWAQVRQGGFLTDPKENPWHQGYTHWCL